MTSDEVAAETTIRTRYGDTVSVRRLVSVEGGALYAAVNDDDRHIGYTFARPEAIRFARALLEAVGEPLILVGDTVNFVGVAGPDRPATLGDVDRILAALRKSEGADPERPHVDRGYGTDVERAFELVRAVQDTVGELTDGIAGEATMKAWRQYRLRVGEAVEQLKEASQIVRALEIERDSLRKAVAERVAERDKALTERDEIGHRLRAENDRLIDRLTAFEREAQASGEAHTNAG